MLLFLMGVSGMNNKAKTLMVRHLCLRQKVSEKQNDRRGLNNFFNRLLSVRALPFPSNR